MSWFEKAVEYIREIYHTDGFIPLHEPRFIGRETEFINECIKSTFVSSVGKFVDDFETGVQDYVGSKRAVVIVNGTHALYLSLLLSGVKKGDEVVTQPLTFIATANAIAYSGALPVFIDVDKDTLGMSPNSLSEFLSIYAEVKDDGFCYNSVTGNRIAACIPMHTFGHPCRISEISLICQKYNIELIEDAAESMGSTFLGKHTGTFGKMGILSFNGNKIITTGGGGMILTNDDEVAIKAKHLSTQAKVPHRWEFNHDMVGYNYRLPNINAALGLAQLEMMNRFLKNKRELATMYANFFESLGVDFVFEPKDAKSNFWLNTILLPDKQERDNFLKYTNDKGIMTRPAWTLMHELPMYKNCTTFNVQTAIWLSERIVNLPSSVRV
jgi:perosamine synthetase